MHGIEHAHAMGSPIRQKVVQAAAKGVNAKFHAEANPQYFGETLLSGVVSVALRN